MRWFKELQRFFFTPFNPVQVKKSSRLYYLIGFGLFVSIFLMIFQPFGMRSIEYPYKLVYFFMYGPITSFAIIINYVFLPKFFHFLYKEKNWNFLKEIIYTLWTLFLIAVFNWQYSIILLPKSEVPLDFIDFLWYTIAVGLIPMTVFAFLSERKHLREHLGISINEVLYKTNGKDPEQLLLFEIHVAPPIVITAGNFLCIKSIGNYSQIFYKSDHEVK